MAIRVDGNPSTHGDGGVTQAGQVDGPKAAAPSPTAPSPPPSVVVPFKSDGAPPIAPAHTNATEATLTAGELRSHVELCKRAADLPLIGQLGAKHHWLRTPHKEVGMGQTPGEIPGHGEAPPVGLSTQWVDHSKEKEKECVVIPDVDVACVERETEFGKDTGKWVPFLNDCHTKTQEVLDKCSTKPKPEPGPDFDDPSKTGAGHSL